VQQHSIPFAVKSTPRRLELIDGSESSGGLITHQTSPMSVLFDDSVTNTTFDITKIPLVPIVLGMPWLRAANPRIDWSTLSISTKHTTAVKYKPASLLAYAASLRPDLEYKPPTPLTTELPPEYADFADVFDPKGVDACPPLRPGFDLPIELLPGKTPPRLRPYQLSPPEDAELKKWLDKNLARGIIEPSDSPAAAPVFMLRRKDKFRPVVDYRGTNAVSVTDSYPLPRIDDLLLRLSKARYFTKLDLTGAYNQLRIRPGDEWKTAFRCRHGHYQYRVMEYGLKNAPARFQRMLNKINEDLLDKSVVVYIDDILIYSETVEEHIQHVREVLSRLRANQLYAKLAKSTFHASEVEYLGFLVSADHISMDHGRVKTVLDWKEPANLKEMQSFLGFANFYRRFIKGFSRIALPLTELTKQSSPYEWTPAAQEAFDTLKQAFTSYPVLIQPDFSKPFILETDASGFALAAILSQYGPDNRLHPVAFFSRKMNPAERNYPVHDQELLAIKCAFEHFRPYLMSSPHPTTVFTDHRNLLHFSSTTKLTRRLAGWSSFFADYNFRIVYRPGTQNGKADSLSRRADFAASSEEESSSASVLPSDVFVGFQAQLTTPETPLIADIRTQTASDSFAQDRIQHLQNHPGFTFSDNLLRYLGRVYVPDGLRQDIISLRHDSKVAGHFGLAKTIKLLARDFWWPKMLTDVRRFIKTCDTCGRIKTPRHAPYGLLQPLPVPQQHWHDITMDFIVDLPKSKQFDSIFVVVDRSSKQAHFIPTTTKLDGPGCAELFLKEVFRIHGLPRTIISDRDSKFLSKFWRRLVQLLGIKHNPSTAYHPQTDGQTERVNQVLEQYLRAFVNHAQTDWVDLLPFAEFAYNNAENSSTKMSPFFANYGFHPRFDTIPHEEEQVPSAESFLDRLKTIHDQLRLNLSDARDAYKNTADARRLPTPDIKVGDHVWLNAKNIKLKTRSKKLSPRNLGPFKVISQVSDVNFKLELPSTMSKIHPVFHVSLLEPAHVDSSRTLPRPPPELVDDEFEYEVETILDSKRVGRGVKYLVHWKGYGVEDRTWEPIKHLANSQDELEAFHRAHPTKPRAKSVTFSA
jgi:hypothetical protein